MQLTFIDALQRARDLHDRSLEPAVASSDTAMDRHGPLPARLAPFHRLAFHFFFFSPFHHGPSSFLALSPSNQQGPVADQRTPLSMKTSRDLLPRPETERESSWRETLARGSGCERGERERETSVCLLIDAGSRRSGRSRIRAMA